LSCLACRLQTINRQQNDTSFATLTEKFQALIFGHKRLRHRPAKSSVATVDVHHSTVHQNVERNFPPLRRKRSLISHARYFFSRYLLNHRHTPWIQGDFLRLAESSQPRPRAGAVGAANPRKSSSQCPKLILGDQPMDVIPLIFADTKTDINSGWHSTSRPVVLALIPPVKWTLRGRRCCRRQISTNCGFRAVLICRRCVAGGCPPFGRSSSEGRRFLCWCNPRQSV